MDKHLDSEKTDAPDEHASRRTFLQHSSSAMMAGGLVAGYGMFAGAAVRFLYPQDAGKSVWQYVCTLDQLKPGDSLPFTMPSGAKVVVARQSDGETSEDFIALSSICPHLGCQVHWEAVNDRFFCPCHNGAFDASGAPTEGPPAAANQYLTRFPLAVDGNLLMIQVPVDGVNVKQESDLA